MRFFCAEVDESKMDKEEKEYSYGVNDSEDDEDEGA